jgi:hypothetical protein
LVLGSSRTLASSISISVISSPADFQQALVCLQHGFDLGFELDAPPFQFGDIAVQLAQSVVGPVDDLIRLELGLVDDVAGLFLGVVLHVLNHPLGLEQGLAESAFTGS